MIRVFFTIFFMLFSGFFLYAQNIDAEGTVWGELAKQGVVAVLMGAAIYWLNTERKRVMDKLDKKEEELKQTWQQTFGLMEIMNVRLERQEGDSERLKEVQRKLGEIKTILDQHDWLQKKTD